MRSRMKNLARLSILALVASTAQSYNVNEIVKSNSDRADFLDAIDVAGVTKQKHIQKWIKNWEKYWNHVQKVADKDENLAEKELEHADRVADAQAVLQMLIAAEEGSNGDDAAAVERLQAVANNTDVPQIYRQIASYKAMARGADVLPVDERRSGFEALAVPGQPLRLLAEEQLALIEIETGDKDAALTRLQALVVDSEVTSGLRRRASQLIVALGGSIEQS